jgi:hypothetical protein
LPAPDVLLPAAGAVLAAVTPSTLDAGWLQQAQAAAAAKRKAKPTRRRQKKNQKKLDNAIRWQH